MHSIHYSRQIGSQASQSASGRPGKRPGIRGENVRLLLDLLDQYHTGRNIGHQ